MKKLLTFITSLFVACTAQSQAQLFGHMDTSDLKLASCSFEKDANAEVLAQNIHIYYKNATVVMEYFKRVKIFNDKGNSAASVRIPYFTGPFNESVSELQAESINLDNGKIIYTPVDKSLIYDQKVDKVLKAITFAFPVVKVGTVVEYKYKWSSTNPGDFPQWLIQGDIPVQHTELKADFSKSFAFNYVWHVTQEFSKDTDYFTNGKNADGGQTHIWALDSVPALKREPFMTPVSENQEHVLFQAAGLTQVSWYQIAYILLRSIGVGKELDPKIRLENEANLLDSVRSRPTQDARVAYIYNLVKNKVHYNNRPGIFTETGINQAWMSRSGNAAEVNFILYHFLKSFGFDPWLVLFDPDSNIDGHYPSPRQLRRVAVYLPADSGKYYVLDATDPDAGYKDIPFDVLNRTAFLLNPSNGASKIERLENLTPQAESISVNAEITTDGKLTATARISSTGYNKALIKKRCREEGESKYIEYLRDGNSQLSISSLKMENIKADSLPLVQNINFKIDNLPGSEGNYIYLDPTLFTRMRINPFLTEERVSDIDFRYLPFTTITGKYKIPQHFKVGALPEPEMVVMPDRSIIFKRIVAEENGYIIVRYTFDFGRSYFRKVEYPELRDFFRKMFDILHEQIALEKI
ncbi:MAG TPA: DUF3857 domain-containing protein [Mucilaginibacter sp.]|nr:DUF3857 domain-containing protein [Mucilaginibacter sp.]